jgi:CheY-like chemotaxis protein
VEGRQVEVVLRGEETSLDRSMLDRAYEPLLHIVRNAVGHGLEPPDERSRLGKPRAGRVVLEARREGHSFAISVEDDGKGLDYEAIAAKGIRLGLLDPAGIPDIPRLNSLIFEPGFSTRQEASAIAGRGVGMDVVAQEVNRLRGTIELSSRPGYGTRFTIRLPGRLSIESTMIVRINGQVVGIPVAHIDRVCNVDPKTSLVGRAWSEATSDGSLQRPLVGLNTPPEEPALPPDLPIVVVNESPGRTANSSKAWPKLLVVRSEGRSIGLVVDCIDGVEELVIRPPGPLLAGHPLISGTSLSTSGEVILIYNSSGLARATFQGDAAERSLFGEESALLRSAETREEIGPRVLVVDDSISVRRLLARQLRNLGFQVDEVTDGLQALGRLRDRSYDLIVTDLEMPRLDGFTLLAELRRVESMASIPVVVASTRDDRETRRRVRELGAREFLAKPVDPFDLIRSIKPLLATLQGD